MAEVAQPEIVNLDEDSDDDWDTKGSVSVAKARNSAAGKNEKTSTYGKRELSPRQPIGQKGKKSPFSHRDSLNGSRAGVTLPGSTIQDLEGKFKEASSNLKSKNENGLGAHTTIDLCADENITKDEDEDEDSSSDEASLSGTPGAAARYFHAPDVSVKCRRCGEVGHFSWDCFNEPMTTACFKCGESGHSSFNCSNSPRNCSFHSF